MVNWDMVSCDKLGLTDMYMTYSTPVDKRQLGEFKDGVSPLVLLAPGVVVGSAATLLLKVMTK